jgi:hypothetical protein
MSQVVLKTAKNFRNNVIWQALYINGKKKIENFKLDTEKVVEAFNCEDDTLIKITIHENKKSKIYQLFPEYDTFQNLRINEEYEIEKGDIVWIGDYQNKQYIVSGGKVTVEKIFNAPVSNIIWDREFIETAASWFSCKEIPGLFCWSKISKTQSGLKTKFGSRKATIKTK